MYILYSLISTLETDTYTQIMWTMKLSFCGGGKDPSQSHACFTWIQYMFFYEVAFLCPITVKLRKQERAQSWILLSGSRATLTTPQLQYYRMLFLPVSRYRSVVSKACVEKLEADIYGWFIQYSLKFEPILIYIPKLANSFFTFLVSHAYSFSLKKICKSSWTSLIVYIITLLFLIDILFPRKFRL